MTVKALVQKLLIFFITFGSLQSMNDDAKKDLAWFKDCLANKALVSSLKNIKLIIADVDGTLTDASIYITEEKEEGRCFSVQDGFVFKPALRSGLLIALMSGKDNQSTIIRGTSLGIPKDMCLVGINNKIEATKKLLHEKNISIEQTLIFGDDFLDADVKVKHGVKLFACPNNTPFYLQSVADIVTPKNGGNQAFRLLLDLILYVQGNHFAQEIIDRVVS